MPEPTAQHLRSLLAGVNARPESLKISRGQDATSAPIAFWQIRAQAIRKLNRFKASKWNASVAVCGRKKSCN